MKNIQLQLNKCVPGAVSPASHNHRSTSGRDQVVPLLIGIDWSSVIQSIWEYRLTFNNQHKFGDKADMKVYQYQ